MRVILFGFGVVGQNLTKLLLSSENDIYTNYGMKPRIVAVTDSKGYVISTSGLDLERLLEIKRSKGSVYYYTDNVTSKGSFKDLDIDELLSLDAECLIDVTPTNIRNGEPSLTYITSAMKHGKNIVTANKGPLAIAFPSLIELAKYNNVILRFSATVGGGTPILEFAKHCLKGDSIMSIKGILNGTTNYILSKMEEGLEFAQALEDARLKGYAEADPTLDIDGYDAAAKLVIIANWIMNLKVTMNDVKFTGIRDVRREDILRLLKEGSTIKLIAECDNKLSVMPQVISKKDPLCVNGTLNAVKFFSERSGELTLIGKGAGGIETASAILRDLIEIREVLSKD
jgi:homoserine dehydrogenase